MSEPKSDWTDPYEEYHRAQEIKPLPINTNETPLTLACWRDGEWHADELANLAAKQERELKNRDEALNARRQYVAKCNHKPELVIDSENGPICCECWALEEKARADRWQSMLEASNHLMPTGNNFPFCVETFFRQVEKMKESSKETGERADFHMKRSVLAMHIAEEPDWMEVVADCPMLAAVKALRARVEQLTLAQRAATGEITLMPAAENEP